MKLYQCQFAHTNAQLFNQLRDLGYSDSERSYMFEAYKFVTEVCAGFQPCGKPFITHLIRTASILVSLQTTITVIAAGLIHAVYEFGDFGDGSRGISEWKRVQVRQRLGQGTELTVMKYSALRWNDASVAATYNSLTTLEPSEQDALLIRLANELEQALDGEVFYRNDCEKTIQKIKHRGDLIIKIAIALGYPTLADRLTQTFQAILSVSDFKTYPRDSYHFSQVSGYLSVKRLLGIRLQSQFNRLQLHQIFHR